MQRPRSLTAVPPLSLAARAGEDLRFIRQTMERAASFTALPGWGGVLMGVVALLAAPAAARAQGEREWILTWLSAALLAFLTGFTDMLHKVRAQRSSLVSGPASRFFLALLPSFFVGGALTIALARAGMWSLVPGTWLCAYGAAVIAAGTHSIRAVRWMGAAYLVLGALALAFPLGRGDLWMALGFGLVHIVYGLWIARSSRG